MKKHNLIIVCLVIIAVCASLFLPSYLINRNINRELGESIQAPNEYYNASASSLSKAMSERLSLSQKLDLVTGEWPREIVEIAVSESEYNPTNYVNLAKNGIASLYSTGDYETSLSTDIDNWYTYDTQLFLCTDTTFDTYSAYYWVITFTKYDQSRKHNILMMDDGHLLCAYACPYEESVDILSLYLSALNTLIVKGEDDYVDIGYDPHYINRLAFADFGYDQSVIHEYSTSPYNEFSDANIYIKYESLPNTEENSSDITMTQKTKDGFFCISLWESQLLKMRENE